MRTLTRAPTLLSALLSQVVTSTREVENATPTVGADGKPLDRKAQAVVNLRKMVMQKQEAETREARGRAELERRAREAAEV